MGSLLCICYLLFSVVLSHSFLLPVARQCRCSDDLWFQVILCFCIEGWLLLLAGGWAGATYNPRLPSSAFGDSDLEPAPVPVRAALFPVVPQVWSLQQTNNLGCFPGPLHIGKFLAPWVCQSSAHLLGCYFSARQSPPRKIGPQFLTSLLVLW